MAIIHVRPAELSDIASITEIYADSVLHGTATFETEPPGVGEMSLRFSALVDNGHPWLVADDGHRVLGYAYAGPYRARLAYRHTVEDSVYLAPDARGKGIGRSLLRQLIDESTRLGFRQMIAVIGGSGNLASIALHRDVGFEMVGTFKDAGHKHGRWLDSVLMQRPLGEGGASPPTRP